MQGLQGTKIALLIDFDNVILGVDDPGFDVELVVNALRSRGVVVMGRAYGDWYRHHRHRRKLMEQGIELVETPVFGPLIKNSADIRIVLDGIEIATSHAHIDAFCLVSGDSDFLPLIKRLQLLGKMVIVIAGNKFTSDLVRRNCNEYIAYENLLAESVGATEDVSTLEGACHLLQRTINTLHERGMDVRSSTVKQMMLQLNPAFSERTFGCSQFKQFLDKAVRAGIVRLGARDGVSGEYAVLLAGDSEGGAAPPPAEARRAANGRDSATRDSATRDSVERNGAGRNGRRRGRGARAETSGSAPAAAPDAASTAPSEAAPDAFVQPDLFASQDDADGAAKPGAGSASTAASGGARSALRRGRLRFSAKSGRISVAPRTGSSTPATSGGEAQPATTEPATVAATGDASDAAVSASDVLESADAVAGGKVEAQDGAAVEPAPADKPTASARDSKKRAPRGGRRRKTEDKSDASRDEAAAMAATQAVEDPTAGGADAVGGVDIGPQDSATQDNASQDAASQDGAPQDDAAQSSAVKKKPARGRRGGTRRAAARPTKGPAQETA